MIVCSYIKVVIVLRNNNSWPNAFAFIRLRLAKHIVVFWLTHIRDCNDWGHYLRHNSGHILGRWRCAYICLSYAVSGISICAACNCRALRLAIYTVSNIINTLENAACHNAEYHCQYCAFGYRRSKSFLGPCPFNNWLFHFFYMLWRILHHRRTGFCLIWEISISRCSIRSCHSIRNGFIPFLCFLFFSSVISKYGFFIFNALCLGNLCLITHMIAVFIIIPFVCCSTLFLVSAIVWI